MRANEWGRRKQREADAILHLFTIDDGSGDGSASKLFVKPDKHIVIDGQEIHEFTIKGHENDHIPPGIDGARLAQKKTDEIGNITYEPLNYRSGERIRQSTINGILVRGTDGKDIFFSTDEFSFTAPAPEPTPAPAPEPTPEPVPAPTPEPKAPPALANLETRATNIISVFALDDDPSKQAQALGISEKIAAEGGSKFKKIIRGIWKGNLALELLQEHDYQYRSKLEAASHVALTDKGIAYIQSQVEAKYTEAMAKKTTLGRKLTEIKDRLADALGGYTTKQRLAIIEAGELSVREQLAVIEQYESKAEANKVRLETFTNADDAVRTNLGEYVEILQPDANDPKRKAIADGVKDLALKYANGTDGYETKLKLQTALDAFAKEQGIGRDTKTGRETQLYASSLYHIAQAVKERIAAGDGEAAIDAMFDAMEVRIGRAQMGEATHVESSKTRKVMEKILQKNIAAPFITNNEATLGTIVAGITSLAILPRMGASRFARLGGGVIGGGLVAGSITGAKENVRLRGEWFSNMRLVEGGGTPEPSDKLRKFMAEREIPQVDVTELISRYTQAAYQDGKLKTDLSGDDLTTTLAALADARARRALSARGGENVSLIRWGGAVDIERTNLDISIAQLERDLAGRFPDARSEFGGKTVGQYSEMLTKTQTLILTEGRDAAKLDPLLEALGAVSDHDIVVQKFRKKFLFGKEESKGEAQGLDEALKDIKTQIRLEATRRGIKAGVIGAGIGAAISEVVHLGDLGLHAIGDARDMVNELTQAVPNHVPTHLVDVPTLAHIADAQGISHAVQAAIPEHTTLVADATSHTFTLMDDGNHPLIQGIMIDPNGHIANEAVLNASPDALTHHLHFSQAEFSLTSPGTETAAGGGFTITEQEMGMNGPWDWVYNTLTGPDSDVEHVIPATNLHKNLFKFWVQQEGHNIMDMKFEHVPDAFNTDGQFAMGHLMDRARDLQDQYMAAHNITADNFPGWRPIYDAIDAQDHAAALAWKIGYVDIPPSQGEYDEFIRLLGASTPETTITMYGAIIQQTIPAHVEKVVGNIFTPMPAVVPLPREGMKPGKKITISQTTPGKPFTLKLPEVLPSMYYGGEGVEFYQNWLKNNPSKLHSYKKINADQEGKHARWVDEKGEPIMRNVQREREILQQYFSEIRSSDPSYYQQLESFSTLPTVAEMTEINRVSVIIPARMEGKNIYNLLQEYTQQTDDAGNKLNPDLYEINIIVNRRIGEIADNTVTEINRFLSEKRAIGENHHVNYVDVEFDAAQANVGNARKTITDLTLLRSLRRTNQQEALYIESEDADLIRVDRYTITNLVKSLDENPHLDAVRGIQDRLPEELMKNDYLFVNQRLHDFMEILLRRDKYRPENNPSWGSKWSFFWHRTITGGWNTGYTAESYALIGGYDKTLTKGEDVTLGEKLTMIRGDGTTPNLDIVGTVGTRSDSSPRRFMHEVLTGQGAYSDAFENEDVNRWIKTASFDELQDAIKPVSRIDQANADKFKALLTNYYSFMGDVTPNQQEAQKLFDSIVMHIGIHKGDYSYNPDGSVSITNLSNLKDALDSYRSRHRTLRKPGERNKFSNETVLPSNLTVNTPVTETPAPTATPEPFTAQVPIIPTPEPAPAPTPEPAPILDPDVELSNKFWANNQPRGMRETMEEIIKTNESKTGELALAVTISAEPDGSPKLSDKDQQRFAAYRILARDNGYIIGEPKLNEHSQSIQAPIVKTTATPVPPPPTPEPAPVTAPADQLSSKITLKPAGASPTPKPTVVEPVVPPAPESPPLKPRKEPIVLQNPVREFTTTPNPAPTEQLPATKHLTTASEPTPQPETLADMPSIFRLLDEHAGSVEIKPDDVRQYLPDIVAQLAPVLDIPPEEILIDSSHTGQTWHIKGKTYYKNQLITLDLMPDTINGFDAKLRLKGFGMKNILAAAAKPELILLGLNNKLTQSIVEKLTLQPDGTIIFTGTKK